MFELLQALIENDPSFLLLRTHDYGSFFHVAVENCRGGSRVASTRVLLLLCSSGMTRLPGDCRFGPRSEAYLLHCACSVDGLHPDVINRLIDLDPDVLMLPSGESLLPIHCALSCRNPSIPVLRRMVELRPEPLLHSDERGRTPVVVALTRVNPSPEMASFLERIVRTSPESLRNARSCANTALFRACQRFHQHPGLIRALVQADPTGLCVSFKVARNLDPLLLPFEMLRTHEAADRALADFLEGETLHMALAIAEITMAGVGFSNEATADADAADADAGADAADALTSFQRHVRQTAARFLPAVVHESERRHRRPAPPSAFATVRAIRELDNRMDFCRALLHHDETQSRLIAWDDDGFRDVMLGDAVQGLYRLNHRDRSNPSPSYQVRLLASASDNLDCKYLQFREHAGHLL